MNRIEIWSPKHSTQSVLVDVRKVKADNVIYFTKAKHLEGHEYYISGEEAKSCPVRSNGRIMCYDISMNKLERTA